MPPDKRFPDDPTEVNETPTPDEDQPVNMLEVEDLPLAGNGRSRPAYRLHALRKARYPNSRREGAAALGITEATLLAHETGARTIGADSAVKYAAHFGVSAGFIMFGEGAPIPVSGIVGPADGVHTYHEGTQHDGTVIAPPYPKHEALAALRVLGRGLGVAYEPGDVVYIDREKLEQPIDRRAVNGRECVVVTAGGAQLLCRVVAGSGDGVVLLRYAGNPDLGIKIVAATPVLWIKRAQADD